METTSQNLYFKPPAHLNAAYLSRHQTPQLWGRLPRERTNGFLAGARMAHKVTAKMPKMPHLANALATPSLGSLAKPPQPVIPRQGPPIFKGPPAGSAMPNVSASPLAANTGMSTSLPSLPKMPSAIPAKVGRRV